VFSGFRRSATQQNPFPANYYSFLNKHGYKDTKPRKPQMNRGESAAWVGSVSAAVDEPYKILLHLKPACSLNKMCYTPREMELAARSLATKPIFLNHKRVGGTVRKPEAAGMWIHADWVPEAGEVQGIGVLESKHLWDEIRMHGFAPVSQRTHYFVSKKYGGQEYPEGIVFDEVSLIVDDENPGKPSDYVEALESWNAVVHYQLETDSSSGVQCSAGWLHLGKRTMSEGEEQATPPKAKLSPLVSYNKGRFGGPAAKRGVGIRPNVNDQPQENREFATRYGQGYSGKPSPATIDLPAKYGPPLNYARIRGGPGVDIPFPAARVQMPGGQPKAEPTAMPHGKEQDGEDDGEDVGSGLPLSSRGVTVRNVPGSPKAPSGKGYLSPPAGAYNKPGSPSGNEAINMNVPQKRGSLLGTPATTPGRHLQAMPPRTDADRSAPGLQAPLEQDDGEDDGEDDDVDMKKKQKEQEKPGKKPTDGEDDGEDAEGGEDSEGETVSETVWTTRYVNSLPAENFARPKERMYPHHGKDGSVDVAHVINCAQTAAQRHDDQALAHCQTHLKQMGIGEFAKSAQDRMRWERYAESIAPFAVVEEQLWLLSARAEEQEANLQVSAQEMFNREFGKTRVGEFLKLVPPKIFKLEDEIEKLKECATEMKGGQSASESAPSASAVGDIVAEVLGHLDRRANEVAHGPLSSRIGLSPTMGRNVAERFAHTEVRNALRKMGFNVPSRVAE